MTDNRPIFKRAMTSKQVNRTKKTSLLDKFTIDYAKRERIRKSLSFARGLTLGIAGTMIMTTDYSVWGTFLVTSNLLILSYVLEETSKTLSEKARPKKIHFS